MADRERHDQADDEGDRVIAILPEEAVVFIGILVFIASMVIFAVPTIEDED